MERTAYQGQYDLMVSETHLAFKNMRLRMLDAAQQARTEIR